MKFINLVFGFVIFVLVLSLMFAGIGDMMKDNNIEGRDTFVELSGQYDGFSDQFDEETSAARNIDAATKTGKAVSEDKDTSILSGALSGGKLVTSFFVNFNNIVNNATEDSRGGGNYIDTKVVDGFLVLIVIFIIFVVLHFVRGFKTET